MPKENETAEDQNVEETDVDETDEDTNDSEGSTEEEETVESLKAKIAEKDRALAKANRERTRLGKKLKEAPEAKADEAPVLTEAAKKAFVIADLKLKGLDDTQARKFSRLVDTADIEIDDDGNVVGIDTDEIEEDFPELFNKANAPAKKNGGRKPSTGDKSGSATPPSAQSDVTKQMLKMAQAN